MAIYPWILPEQQSQSLDDFPHLRRWRSEIAARPATLSAYAKGITVNTAPVVTKESARLLFRQKARR